ncbi:MAG: hypothetical protein ACLQLG_02825 [Thermoguttaceae bacterium]
MSDDRKPWQFGLSSLFLVTLVLALVLGWLTRPSYVDLTIVSVTRDVLGGAEVTFRVTRPVEARLSRGDFTEDGRPGNGTYCSWRGSLADRVTVTGRAGAPDMNTQPQTRWPGIAPSWQNSVALVRPGETYRLTESQPLRILRGMDGQGTLTYCWLFLGTPENVRRRCPPAAKTQP